LHRMNRMNTVPLPPASNMCLLCMPAAGHLHGVPRSGGAAVHQDLPDRVPCLSAEQLVCLRHCVSVSGCTRVLCACRMGTVQTPPSWYDPQTCVRYVCLPQVICMVCHSVEMQQSASPFLIVCPASVLSNWANELQHWAPDLSVVQYRGSADAREEIYRRQVSSKI
jgi:hypothetical protein